MRTVCGVSRYSSKLLLYAETTWQPLYKRRLFHRLVLFFKIINGLASDHLVSILRFHIDNTRRELRNANDLRVIFARTEAFKTSFFPNTMRDWNLLSHDTKSSVNISHFKSKLKNELYNTEQHFAYYYYGSRKVNTILASMRTRCSILRNDLYRNNVVDSALCDCWKRK